MENNTDTLTRIHLIIINPVSFSSKIDLEKYVLETENLFADIGKESFVHVSRFPRDAIMTIRKFIALKKPETIIRVYAVGGDGILFDCLNGIIGLGNAELAPVPYGHSNDFVRSFGNGKLNLFLDIKTLASAPVIPTDVIFCGNNYALNTCTIGMEAYTVHKAVEYNTRFKDIWNKMPRSIGNFLYDFMFFWAGVVSSMSRSITSQEYDILIDGDAITGPFTTINIANGPCYGGDKNAAIAAVPDDGLLDVLLFKTTNRPNIVRVGTRYIYGGYRNFPKYISYRRGKEITVRSIKPMVLQLDGEIFFDKNITFKVIPKAVKIVAPGGINYEQKDVIDEL
jgi:YegS/Rv2252/BmrU family lipid kinase